MMSVGTIVTTVNSITRHTNVTRSVYPVWILRQKFRRLSAARPSPEDEPADDDDPFCDCQDRYAGWDLIATFDADGMMIYVYPRGLEDTLMSVYAAVGGVL